MSNADDEKVNALTDEEALKSPADGLDAATPESSAADADEAAPGEKAPEPSATSKATSGPSKRPSRAGEGLPIKMMHDRILVQLEGPEGDRKSSGGILIPATAQVGKRLTWAEIVAAGPSVRSMELGDRVLFNPEDRYEVEVGGKEYIILRERDVHAVAAERLDDSPMGLYL